MLRLRVLPSARSMEREERHVVECQWVFQVARSRSREVQVETDVTYVCFGSTFAPYPSTEYSEIETDVRTFSVIVMCISLKSYHDWWMSL